MCPTTPRLVRPAKILAGMERAFELCKELVEDSADGALAYVRDLNTATGTYSTSSVQFTVKDLRQVGYYGDAGAKGKARAVRVESGWEWEIVDMECP